MAGPCASGSGQDIEQTVAYPQRRRRGLRRRHWHSYARIPSSEVTSRLVRLLLAEMHIEAAGAQIHPCLCQLLLQTVTVMRECIKRLLPVDCHANVHAVG